MGKDHAGLQPPHTRTRGYSEQRVIQNKERRERISYEGGTIKKQGKEELFILMKKRKNIEEGEGGVSARGSLVCDPMCAILSPLYFVKRCKLLKTNHFRVA